MNKKRITALLLCIIMMFTLTLSASAAEDVSGGDGGTLQEGTDESTEGSSDTQSDTLCENISDLLVTDEHVAYIGGFKDGSFKPKSNITRAQAAQIFYNLLKEKPEGTASFTDIAEDAWYAPAVNAMAVLGAIRGYGDNTFRPENYITRAEFVTIAGRFCALKEGVSSFTDVKEGNWAKKYIDSACAYGWINGYGNGIFKPSGYINRAEAVKVVNSMLERSADKDAVSIYYTVEFNDVSRSYWAYSHICEAATDHEYEKNPDSSETWLIPNERDGSGWEIDGNITRYRDSSSGELLYGWQRITGYTYYFDMESGNLLSGWQKIGEKNYYLPGVEQAKSAPEVKELLTTVNYNSGNRTYGDIKYITIHYTGVVRDTAKDECESFYDTYREASAHYFVDDREIWRCVQDKDISWHCGNDIYYHEDCRNSNSIGIEMCSLKVDDNSQSAYDDDWYFAYDTEKNTVTLVRELMMMYGIPLENIVRHNDVSHKVCPAPYTNDFSQWQNFLKLISDGKSDYDGSYSAVITAQEVYLRTGPGTTYPAVGTLKEGSKITVLEEAGKDNAGSGRWVKTPGGWVNYPYIMRLSS